MGARMKSVFSAAPWVLWIFMLVLFSKGLVLGADLSETEHGLWICQDFTAVA